MLIFRLFNFVKNFSMRVHFSQHGEDVVIHKMFDKSLTNGFYLDIGAYHPFKQSNTAYLWLKGWSGVNVDANPASVKIFNAVRKKDSNVWAAVVDDITASKQSEIELHFNNKIDLGGSCDSETFSHRVTSNKLIVPCRSMTDIVNTYAPDEGGEFHFMNVDIEGFDFKAIRGMSGWKSKPMVLCIEAIGMNNLRAILSSELNIFLESQGYELVGKTGISAIYKLRLMLDI